MAVPRGLTVTWFTLTTAGQLFHEQNFNPIGKIY
jgi:hypothetical protein